MNEKDNCNFIIAIVILSVVLTISIGLNIGFGKSVADNNGFREQQRRYEETIKRLEAEQNTDREAIRELRNLNREAEGIIEGIIRGTETAGTNLTAANKILRYVIDSLQSLNLLYSRNRSSWVDGVDSLVGE
jgi:hypothetical protein